MCTKIPANARAEGNLWPWLRLEFPLNVVVQGPKPAPNVRPPFGRVTDDRAFCSTNCLMLWVSGNTDLLQSGQEQALNGMIQIDDSTKGTMQ